MTRSVGPLLGHWTAEAVFTDAPHAPPRSPVARCESGHSGAMPIGDTLPAGQARPAGTTTRSHDLQASGGVLRSWPTIFPPEASHVAVDLVLDGQLALSARGAYAVETIEILRDEFRTTYHPKTGPLTAAATVAMVEWLRAQRRTLSLHGGDEPTWSNRRALESAFAASHQPLTLVALTRCIEVSAPLLPTGLVGVAQLVTSAETLLRAADIAAVLPTTVPGRKTTTWSMLETALGMRLDRRLSRAPLEEWNALIAALCRYCETPLTRGYPPFAAVACEELTRTAQLTDLTLLLDRLADTGWAAWEASPANALANRNALFGGIETGIDGPGLVERTAASFTALLTQQVCHALEKVSRPGDEDPLFARNAAESAIASKTATLHRIIHATPELEAAVAAAAQVRAKRIFLAERFRQRRRIPSRRAAERLLTRQFGTGGLDLMRDPRVMLGILPFLAFVRRKQLTDAVSAWDRYRAASTSRTFYRAVVCDEALIKDFHREGLRCGWVRAGHGALDRVADIADLQPLLRQHLANATQSPFISVSRNPTTAIAAARAHAGAARRRGEPTLVFRLALPESDLLEISGIESVAVGAIPVPSDTLVRRVPADLHFPIELVLANLNGSFAQDFFEDLEAVPQR